jgi:hypothetical protein
MAVPLLVVLDLDMCCWDPEMFQLSGVGSIDNLFFPVSLPHSLLPPILLGNGSTFEALLPKLLLNVHLPFPLQVPLPSGMQRTTR